MCRDKTIRNEVQDRYVLCTDHDPIALALMQESIFHASNTQMINYLQQNNITLALQNLDWIDYLNTVPTSDSCFDCKPSILLGSALIYSPAHAAVAHVLK